MALQWQDVKKTVQSEMALKKAILENPIVCRALFRHINSLNLQAQVNAHTMTPNDAVRKLYTTQKVFLDHINAYVKQQARAHDDLQVTLQMRPPEQLKQKPQNSDYSLTQNREAALANPDSLTSQLNVEATPLSFSSTDKAPLEPITTEEMAAAVAAWLEAEADNNEQQQLTEQVQQQQEETQEEAPPTALNDDETHSVTDDAEKGIAALAGLKAIEALDKTGFEKAAEDLTGIKGDLENFGKKVDDTAHNKLLEERKFTPPTPKPRE